MIRLISAVLVLSASIALADEKLKSPKPDGVELKAPEGWFGERIKLPPGFARDMKFEGTEDIKFAPGMFKPDNADFFSYAFVFELTKESKIDQKSLDTEFLKYYRGLCKAVSKDKPDTKDFTVKLKPIKAEATKSEPKGIKQFHGDIDWIEPFRTNRRQTLHVELQVWQAKQFNYLFVCVSPQAKSAKIWKSLHKVRADFHAANRSGK